MESRSSCEPQPYCYPAPPIAQVPSPTRVSSSPLFPKAFFYTAFLLAHVMPQPTPGKARQRRQSALAAAQSAAAASEKLNREASVMRRMFPDLLGRLLVWIFRGMISEAVEREAANRSFSWYADPRPF